MGSVGTKVLYINGRCGSKFPRYARSFEETREETREQRQYIINVQYYINIVSQSLKWQLKLSLVEMSLTCFHQSSNQKGSQSVWKPQEYPNSEAIKHRSLATTVMVRNSDFGNSFYCLLNVDVLFLSFRRIILLFLNVYNVRYLSKSHDGWELKITSLYVNKVDSLLLGFIFNHNLLWYSDILNWWFASCSISFEIHQMKWDSPNETITSNPNAIVAY